MSKKRKTRKNNKRKSRKQRGGVPLSTSQYKPAGAGSAVEMSRATNYFSDIISQNKHSPTSLLPRDEFVIYDIPKMYPFNYNWWGQNLGIYMGGGKKRKTRKRKSRKK
jgi:hypothetical protein